MSEENNLAVELYRPMQVSEMKDQIQTVHNFMNEILEVGKHYGTIPGCGKKPTLLLPGAQKLAMAFHFASSYEVKAEDIGDYDREYTVNCVLTSRKTGEVIGGGVGFCSSEEKKYKRDNPPDIFNTVLKMAKKRAYVDAVLTATAASDIFTQDIEDMEFGDSKGNVDLDKEKQKPRETSVVHEDKTPDNGFKNPTEWKNPNLSDKQINWFVKEAKKNNHTVEEVEQFAEKSLSEINRDDWKILFENFTETVVN